VSLVETIVGVAAGSVLGLASSLVAQNYLLKRQKSEDTKERVYSPLYDEITAALEQLEEHDSPQTPEWDRISKQEHLTYRISDAALQNDLRRFHGPTRDLFNMKEGLCTSFYPVLVAADLNARLGKSATLDTMSDIQTVSQAIGWNLQRGLIPPHLLPSASASYEKIRMLPPRFDHDNLIDYFQWWKDKTASQRQMIEYREARDRALQEAASLKERLGKRLGLRMPK
jgi:hypothetical protein